MEAMKARDGARSIANPQLLGELRNRVAEDQAARRAWLRSGGSGRDVQMIDEKNLKWLRGLIRDSGFPNADQVGEDGVHLAWLLLQHADYDPQFQRSMLPALVERWKHHELPGDDLARLTDRILKASGSRSALVRSSIGGRQRSAFPITMLSTRFTRIEHSSV